MSRCGQIELNIYHVLGMRGNKDKKHHPAFSKLENLLGLSLCKVMSTIQKVVKVKE